MSVVAGRLRGDAFIRRATRQRADYRIGPRVPWYRVRPAHGAGPLVLAVAAVLLTGTRQAFTVPFTGLGLSPAQLILFVLACLWLVTRAAGQRAPAGLGLLTAVVVVRMMCTLLSYGVDSAHALTVEQRTATNQAIVTELVAGTVVIVLATLLRSRRDVELVLRALVVGATLSGLFAVIQYGTGTDIAARVRFPGLHEVTAAPAVALLREGLVRAQGSAAAPLELGAVTTVLIPVAIALFFSARHRGERSWFWAVAVVVMAGGAVVSLSRSIFIGLGVALLVMFARWPLRRSLVVLGVGAAVSVAALASGTAVVSAIVTVLTKGSNDYSLGSRSNGRSYVFAHFVDHLWLGQGPGTYDLGTQPVLDNQYLSQLIETGVLGLLLLVAVLACAFGYALRASSRGAAPDTAELATGIAGALAAVLVVDAVLDTAGFVQIFTLIWMLIGLAGAIWRVRMRDADVAGPTRAAARPAAAEAR